MFIHNKRLQYTVRVARPNPGLANLLLEQFGGAQGELAAAERQVSRRFLRKRFDERRARRIRHHRRHSPR
ncbi:hypothetical protein CFBP3846_05582 [Pseudomonas syringae pv. avii]|uniref:Uncharacterized protein n=1 Tax=Pseudomonas syringae pv. avii TaxID=663959 RepID=A0ABY1UGB3_PSESX|nr:hypothetical protein CFBP3846_05582 [Pseudomonas syringae pv. avii]